MSLEAINESNQSTIGNNEKTREQKLGEVITREFSTLVGKVLAEFAINRERESEKEFQSELKRRNIKLEKEKKRNIDTWLRDYEERLMQ